MPPEENGPPAPQRTAQQLVAAASDDTPNHTGCSGVHELRTRPAKAALEGIPQHHKNVASAINVSFAIERLAGRGARIRPRRHASAAV
jgi:hypothetical protein